MQVTKNKKAITLGSIEWSVAAPNLIICDCLKCGGNGKYFYKDKSVGNCYTCLGLGMTIEGGAKPNYLQPGQREVTQMIWDEANGKITVWYITRDKIGDVTPWRRVYSKSNLKEDGLDLMRQLWAMVPTKALLAAAQTTRRSTNHG